ncbi:MAG: methyltransferase [Candidatus Woesearchaeota archaeon]
MGNLELFRQFLNDRKVASVVPTTQRAVRKICQSIDFEKDNVYVEFGPGTGAFTKYILERMSPGSRLFLFETNHMFFSNLGRNYGNSRVQVFHDSAENVRQRLHDNGVSCVDYIVSGIPFSMLSEHSADRIISDSREALSENGRFIAYQCTTSISGYMSRYFRNVNVSYTLNWLLPPLRVLEGFGRI